MTKPEKDKCENLNEEGISWYKLHEKIGRQTIHKTRNTKVQVLVDGQETELTYKEYQLLKMLIQNSGIVLQRSQILDRVWGIDYEGESRTLDMHIKTLRRKIGEKGSLIQTVRNVGYTMNYRKDK